MKRQYETKNLGAGKLAMIRQANLIIAEYSAQGFSLTLRQLYYQFVARDLLPNNLRSYKRLGDAINDGRMNGMIDWHAIEDRTRNLRGVTTWPGPRTRMKQVAGGYSTDKWKKQPTRPEVWIEKDALVGIVNGVCVRNQVDYMSCRGFMSASEMWSSAQRIGRNLRAGQSVHIIHLGDHDPSGIDMSRDIEDRIRTFLRGDDADFLRTNNQDIIQQALTVNGVSSGSELRKLFPGAHAELTDILDRQVASWGRFTFQRIALNMDQIEVLQPPPNPAKLTDSRAVKYIEEFGDESWELDALSPAYLDSIISDAIDEVRDEDIWQAEVDRETKERKMLREIGDHWDDVRQFLNANRRALKDPPAGERGSRGSAPGSADSGTAPPSGPSGS